MLRAAVANGAVYGPEERITVEEAIAAYTTGGAWQDFADHEKGSLEPGMLADLCALGGDPLTTDPAEIPEMPILATVLDGAPVYVA